MPREYNRSRRVGDQLQRVLAPLIQREIKDPRVGMVTISGVEVSKDLAHASVYVTVMEDKGEPDVTLWVLNRAAGHLRHEMAHALCLRTIPVLHFFYDHSIGRGSRLSALIEAAVAADKRNKE